MEPESKKNQVKHGKHGSIMAAHIFPWKPLFFGLTISKKRTTPPRLKSIHRICVHSTYLYWVVRSSKGAGGITQVSQKEKRF